MGIYKPKNCKVYWLRKSINSIKYRKSAETTSKMRAQVAYEEWVSELKEQIRTGRPVITTVKEEPKKSYSFSELADKYLEYTAGRLKGHDRNITNVNTLNKYFGAKCLMDISIGDVELFQSEKIKSDKAVSYINKLTAVLKRMFAKAYDWDLIDRDGLERIRKVKQLKGENKRLRYLSEEESERLIDNCDIHLKPIVVTALNTGMRRGEILGLTWDRVDLKNRIILLDKTKNGERREIPMNDTLYNELAGLIRSIKTDYVFYNPQTLKAYDNVKKSFASALRKSHILDFRFHDLRHTFASRLVMAGIDLTTVKELLGHKDIKMTLRYSHLAASHIKNAVSILDKNKGHKKGITGKYAEI
jgi:integrase